VPELRKDPVVGRWVIISTERARRPTDFNTEPVRPRGGTCVFCTGNEDKTPPEIAAVRPPDTRRDGPGWSLRVVPNKFPALRIEGDLEPSAEGLYDRMNGVGAHEVVIETPDLRLLVEPGSAANLEGAIIDLDPSAMGGALRIDNPNEGWRDPIAARIQEVLDRQINPSVAAHGGFVDLLEVRGGAAYVQLGGGCQGCAQVDVTLRQGIEVAIMAAVPQITEVIDVTDHAAGTNPYFQPAKKAS